MVAKKWSIKNDVGFFNWIKMFRKRDISSRHYWYFNMSFLRDFGVFSSRFVLFHKISLFFICSFLRFWNKSKTKCSKIHLGIINNKTYITSWTISLLCSILTQFKNPSKIPTDRMFVTSLSPLLCLRLAINFLASILKCQKIWSVDNKADKRNFWVPPWDKPIIF